MRYRPRIADRELADRVGAAGAVVIEGARACGKTETARQIAASEALLDVDENAREAAEISPALVLDGPTPRLIDEWQLEPAIWNHVRRAVDDRGQPGQFILTGSAVPADDATRHSGAGRFSRLRMRPMSMFEAGTATGAISLADLLQGEPVQSPDPGLTVEDVAEEIARGGWPGFRDLSVSDALQRVRDYLEEVRRVDIAEVEGVRRDPERVGRLLRSLARNIATHSAAATLARDAGEPDGALAEHTVAAYLRALTRVFVVEDQPAWAPHLRSRYALRRAAKRHFVDPSLAVAALEADPAALLRDLNLMGLLFESLVVRDLRVHAQPAGAKVLQYRDGSGLEVDAIVEAPGGDWAAFEVKLGGEKLVDQAAENLKRFARQIDTRRCGEPRALAIITATGYGYKRPDGVTLIPIGALGP